MAAIVVLVAGGCCHPLVLSHRFYPDGPDSSYVTEIADQDPFVDEATCGCGSVVRHFFHYAARPHRLLPGASLDGRGMLAADSSEAVAPRPKFHPVPTRPVFRPEPIPGAAPFPLHGKVEDGPLPPVPEPELLPPLQQEPEL